MAGQPYSKDEQLARQTPRYHRVVASPKKWQAIADAKQGPCRVCDDKPPNELHHIISRAQGGGDVAENIAPLCHDCHGFITRRNQPTIKAFLTSLTDDEYAYAVEQGGEDFFERAYGLRYDR